MHPFTQVCLKDWEEGRGATGASACCNMIRHPNFDPMELAGKVSKLTIPEIFNMPSFNELRSSMIAGERHSACAVCWDSEDIGNYSPRLTSKYIATADINATPTVSVIDIKFGEHCNLRCRMCTPGSSNKLRIDIRKFSDADRTFMTDENPVTGFSSVASKLSEHHNHWWDDNNPTYASLFDDAVISNLLLIKTAGGEPLLSKEYQMVLTKLVDTGHAPRIGLVITTNATLLTEEWLDLLSAFKSVNIVLSIDGIGKTYEYIRYPMKWDTVSHNIDMLVTRMAATKTITCYASCAVSLYNVLTLPDLLTWGRSKDIRIGFDMVHPSGGRLDIALLPQYIKDKLITLFNADKCLTGVANYLQHTINQRPPAEFKREMLAYDHTRDQTYRDYLHTEIIDWVDTLG